MALGPSVRGPAVAVIACTVALTVVWNRVRAARLSRSELEGTWGCGCPQPACVPCPYTPQAYAPYPTVQAPAFVPQPVAQTPYAPQPAVPLPSLPSISVPQVHVADPKVMDPVVLEPHVLEPQVMSPHVENPHVAEPSVPNVDVQASDIEQEEQARKDGKPLLRQQTGPDAPQLPRASATASLAFNNAMHIQGQQYLQAEHHVAVQNRKARDAVYRPCYDAGAGCGAAQQQLASSQLPWLRRRRGQRATGIDSALQRGVHFWQRPRGARKA